MIMDRLYGGVCYAGIDTDPELKYPKGAGRVAFSNQQSYIAAISARFVQLQHGEIDKRVSEKRRGGVFQLPLVLPIRIRSACFLTEQALGWDCPRPVQPGFLSDKAGSAFRSESGIPAGLDLDSLVLTL